jgi:hypothetical protein
VNGLTTGASLDLFESSEAELQKDIGLWGPDRDCGHHSSRIRLTAVDAEPKGPNSNPEPYAPNGIDRAPAAGVRIRPALRSSLLRKASRSLIIEKPTNSKLMLSTKVL